ncbi:TPA: hypothetical protein DCY43_00115 [candidate division WWE3 bacterium]|uniref:Uncharacterized protein n=1 Tax=candidate division WWE3 bacterium TaxID=2053526 RepID=A0A351JS80_UNCKA|nr:hypothetical protein P147_WWE3C00001G0613 [candidate division WWE3 bacterium RAAC2_WWE3_1]KKS29288.1 MAG: hypothetical protein UU91_C0007G0037 [candidate division WWE3 bacterium GW2011_GWB1_42_117]KKS54581.1 MAG: hypothetical protein UV21_C0006G0039 [candidate division WWE3 bacterium GW2011_GWD2_42_34]KKT06561.1 MAG: hypothetical protein UV84_C0006G0042 [candidate division WWE3 bacterium GW2011_GWF2_43_18]KKT08272.1 MAG: hypothetical protein UV87_C0005G0039 [candidate division WWE3 bacterium
MAFWKRNKKKDVPLVAFDEDPAVEPAEVVEAEVVEPAEVVEEVKPVSRNSDRTAIIVVGSLAIVLFATLVVVGLLFANSVSKAAALEPVAPAVVVAEAAKPAADAEVPAAPVAVEQPKTVAQAQTTASLPVIMTVTQVGGGEFITGWEVKPTGWPQVTTGTVTLPMEDKRDWDGIIKENGKPVFVVIISSDAGNANAKQVDYPFPDKGFVAGFITTEPNSIAITTGWNDQNEHFNVWMEKFIVPTDEVLDDVLKAKLAEKQATEKKPVAFAILSTGEIFKLK